MKYAGQYARIEFHKSKGMSAPSEKPIGSGSHTCLTCLINFDSRPTLNQHYKSDLHREVSHLYLMNVFGRYFVLLDQYYSIKHWATF